MSVAGTTAAVPGGAVGGRDIGAQTRESLRRIDAALQEVGAELQHVVRTRIFVTDIGRWQKVDRVHGEVFERIRPVAIGPCTAVLTLPDQGPRYVRPPARVLAMLRAAPDYDPPSPSPNTVQLVGGGEILGLG